MGMRREPTIHKIKTVMSGSSVELANDMLISGWILLDAKNHEGNDIYMLGHAEEVSLPWKRQALPEQGFEVCRNRRR